MGEVEPASTNSQQSHCRCPSFFQKIRKFCRDLVTWRGFESLTVIIILANCVTLAAVDPFDADCILPRCQILFWAELVLFCYFALEMVLKIIALGLVGKDSYLAQPWNRFDCFIVVMGAVEYIFVYGDLNFSAIRAFRIFRPLRTLNRIPSLRFLIMLLLDTLPMLSNVLLFCSLLFFIFGILGVQLLAGLLRNRCFFPANMTIANASNSSPPSFMPAYYERPESHPYICTTGGGLLKCEDIPLYEKEWSMCSEMFGSDDSPETMSCSKWVANYTECRSDGPNPDKGSVSFDHIGAAWRAIFQVITIQGWTKLMYFVQDAFSFWIWVYFILIVFTGSYFAVNLCLVVITTQFTITKSRETQKMFSKCMWLLVPLAFAEASSPSLGGTFSITAYDPEMVEVVTIAEGSMVVQDKDSNLYTQIFDMIAQACRACWTKIGCKPKDSPAIRNAQNSRPSSCAWLKSRINENRAFFRGVLEHPVVTVMIILVILLNAALMAAEHHGQPEMMSVTLRYSDWFFCVFFAIEVFLKVYAYGIPVYLRDAMNLLDLITVVVNLFEMFDGHGTKLSVLRTFRLVRILKLVRFLPQLRRQLNVMLHTIDNVATYFVLLFFFLFVFALLGMSLFGCRFCPYHEKLADPNPNITITNMTLANGTEVRTTWLGEKTDLTSYELSVLAYYTCPRANFDSFPQSLFTVLQIFTQDSWSMVLYDGVFYGLDVTGLYFIALVSIGNYVLLNLLVAILVQGLSEAEEEVTEASTDKKLRISKSASKIAASIQRAEHGSTRNGVQLSEEPSAQRPMLTQPNQPDDAKDRKGRCSCCEARASYSLFFLPESNLCRRRLLKIVKSNRFDNLVLAFILANCLTIMLERPAIDPDSIERYCIDAANYTFTVIFAFEALAKILALGFVVGPDAYLKSRWNILDFALVAVSIVSNTLQFVWTQTSETKLLGMLRVLRMLRGLRPLRMINRVPGIKIVAETLLVSIKPIANVLIICMTFFMIFSILGVQLFRGCFYSCSASTSDLAENTTLSIRNTTARGVAFSPERAHLPINEALYTVQNKSDCLALGFEWVNKPLNFDNVLQGLISLFVFTTYDGWVDIARDGIDCVGVDQQPQRDYNPWNIIFFIAFLFIVCLFIMNMFIGVVVQNFQQVQERVRAEFEERNISKRSKNSPVDSQGDAGAVMKRDSQTEDLSYLANYSKQRRVIHSVVTHDLFELAVTTVIMLNIVLMAIEHYQMAEVLAFSLRIIGYVFAGLLVLEAIFKIIALGGSRYFGQLWNTFDFIIVILSLGGIVIEEVDVLEIPINPSIIRFARIVRIARIFKLLKMAPGIRRLLETVRRALPQVCNLGLFFGLVFFIYASLGVELFGKLSCEYGKCEGLSRHGNFHHFGMALLTLFRIFTGDNWGAFLKATLRILNDKEECAALMQSAANKVPDSDMAFECNLAGSIAPIYFVSFVQICKFVLLNVVVAILMSELEDAHKREALEKLQKLERSKSAKEMATRQSVAEFTPASNGAVSQPEAAESNC